MYLTNKAKNGVLILILALAILALPCATSAAPTINFVSPTPSNGSSQSSNSIYVNVSSSDASRHYTMLDWSNNSLVGWWRFEETSGTSFTDDSSRGNTGSCSNCPTYNASGVFNGSYDFNSSQSQYITVGYNEDFNFTDQMTIALWFKYRNSQSAGLLSNRIGSSSSYNLYISTTNLILDIANATTHQTTSAYPISVNTWYHAVATYNGSVMKIYINGTSVRTQTQTGDVQDQSFNIQIGRYQASYLNGSIDDVMMFRRALSDAEVLALYNATANQYYNNFTNLSNGNYSFKAYAVNTAGNLASTETRTVTISPDTTPPASVTNLANQSAGTTWIYWNWTNSTDADFSQAIVYIDGSNVVNTSNNYYNATGFTCGTSHNITINTKDTTGNVNTTNVSSTASTSACPDTTFPTITIALPTNTTYTTKTNLALNYTATDNIAVDKCWYSLDSGVNNSLASCANTTFNVSTDGSHNIRVYANDTSNNINSSIVYFSVDTTPPSSITNLANQSAGTTWIYWNWTNLTDSDFNESIIYLDGVWKANTSNNYYNATSLTANTQYTITIHTKDTTGNINNTDVNNTASTLQIPDNAPNVTLNQPTANYVNDSSDPVSVIFNCSATDDNKLVNISLYITNSNNQSFALNQSTNISGTSNSTTWTLSLSNGNYTWNCLAYDNASQSDWNVNRSIKINYTAPAPSCGDGSCNGGETCSTCPADCGSCGGGGSSGGGGGIVLTCKESWLCTAWSACANDKQTRTCADSNKCNTTKSKPAESRGCVVCGEYWICSDWGACVDYKQARLCKDVNECGAEATKPVEEQACGTPCEDGIQNQGEEGIDCGGPCKPCLTGEKLTGQTVSVAPYKPANPIYIIPTVLLLMVLVGIVSLRKTRLNPKMKKIVTALHISLVALIALFIALTFTKHPSATGMIVKTVPAATSSISTTAVSGMLLTAVMLIGIIYVTYIFRKRNQW